MDYIKTYDNIISEETCLKIIYLIEDILGRTDPGHGVTETPNGYAILSKIYGSLHSQQEKILEPLWRCWYDYDKLNDVTDRTFPEIFDPDWIYEKTFHGDVKDKHEQSSRYEKERFAAWMLFLNTLETNDEEFVNQGVTIKPKAGTVIIWPASYTHKHRQLDLFANRYVARGWFRYPETGGIKKT